MEEYVLYTDPVLVDLLRQGDRDAFDALYRRYWRLADKEQTKDFLKYVSAPARGAQEAPDVKDIAVSLFSSVLLPYQSKCAGIWNTKVLIEK